MLSSLLGLPVRTESGDSLGHVHDVRARVSEQSLRVIGLCVGRRGTLEHFGIGAPNTSARIRGKDVVPWSSVVRADARGVVVRDGTRPR